MKVLSLFVFICCLCRCDNSNERIYNEPSADSIAHMHVAAEPAALEEMVKFSPPNINDDELSEEGGNYIKDKKIIKDGSIGIRVSDLANAKKHVDSLIKKHKAYYSTEEYNDYD